uniref:Uncharacterized protein n=1 Tax=uncultured prokaryote TaxID=198431 RepID=H5SGB0_9ZZZZ|nr:hypothetical protein HGMM_F24F10C14 [uncultured prokaryote]
MQTVTDRRGIRRGSGDDATGRIEPEHHFLSRDRKIPHGAGPILVGVTGWQVYPLTAALLPKVSTEQCANLVTDSSQIDAPKGAPTAAAENNLRRDRDAFTRAR